jgi:2-methylcitrate dehydratase
MYILVIKSGNMSVTRALAEFVFHLRFKKMPSLVIQQAKRLILDTLACGLGCYQTPISEIVVEFVKELGGKPESTIIGYGQKTSCLNAAFANAAIADCHDATDYGNSHPANPILSSAMAIAEREGSTGKELLEALVAGYEGCAKIMLASNPSLQNMNKLWGCATWDVFGAMFAASKILHLDEEKTVNAIGIAGSTAPVQSFWKAIQPTVSMNKHGSAWAAWLGLASALLASKGFVSHKTILDGDRAFWVMAGVDRWEPNRITRRTREYEILKTSLKPYPCCGFLLPSIDSTLSLVREHDIAPTDIEEITVETFRHICSKPWTTVKPKNMFDASFSLPYCIAVSLLEKLGPNWYTNEKYQDARINDIAKKVKILGNPDISEKHEKQGKLSSMVKITLRNGKQYSNKTEVPRGRPDNPMTDAEIRSKFRAFASMLSEGKQSKIIGTVSKLNELDKISKLTELLKSS